MIAMSARILVATRTTTRRRIAVVAARIELWL